MSTKIPSQTPKPLEMEERLRRVALATYLDDDNESCGEFRISDLMEFLREIADFTEPPKEPTK